MFELITSESINGLTNSELKKELKKVTTAIGTIGKKTKEMAVSINNIMTQESYKDDFKSDTEFAKFLGTSKGNLSKISRAGKLLKENENLSVFNLGQIEETLPLNDETRNYIIEEKEIKPSMTVKEVREIVNTYKSDAEEWEDPEETEEVEETEIFNCLRIIYFKAGSEDASEASYIRTMDELKKLIDRLEKIRLENVKKFIKTSDKTD